MHLESAHSALNDELLDDNSEGHQSNEHELGHRLVLVNKALGETGAEKKSTVQSVECQNKLEDVESGLHEIDLLVLFEDTIVYKAKLCQRLCDNQYCEEDKGANGRDAEPVSTLDVIERLFGCAAKASGDFTNLKDFYD